MRHASECSDASKGSEQPTSIAVKLGVVEARDKRLEGLEGPVHLEVTCE